MQNKLALIEEVRTKLLPRNMAVAGSLYARQPWR